MHSKCRPPRMQEQRPSFQMQIALLRMSHTGAKTVYYNTCCYTRNIVKRILISTKNSIDEYLSGYCAVIPFLHGNERAEGMFVITGILHSSEAFLHSCEHEL